MAKNLLKQGGLHVFLSWFTFNFLWASAKTSKSGGGFPPNWKGLLKKQGVPDAPTQRL